MPVRRLRILALALLFAVPAQADNFMVGAGGFVSHPKDGTETYFSQLGYGGGLFYEAPFHGIIRAEMDVLYLKRRFGAGADENLYQFSSDLVQFPLLFRLSLGSGWSIGAGGYYSRFISKLKARTSLGESMASHPQLYDYGALFSVRGGGDPTSPIFIEYRYGRGLTNIFANGKAHYQEMQFLLGFCLSKPEGKTRNRFCY